MTTNDDDRALWRYQVISPYLAMEPDRGRKKAMLDHLAAKTWRDADGEPRRIAAETIRVWVRRYRKGGLRALGDKPRPRRGMQALPPAVIELACQLKREVPERSLDRIQRILEDTGKVAAGTVRRSTLHRALQREGLSARQARVPDSEDLDRFEADSSNDLWQSDMLAGPWLPDPDFGGKVRRAWLYAFLDDHSRLLLHGRFAFKGDLPSLELVFRRSVQKWGVPRRVYYDNGAVYRSNHMKRVVAELGIDGITYTREYRPMGHGKIEAWNRFCTSAFIAEVKASRIKTLDALNEAFVAWCDREYNAKVHGETGEAPLHRWRNEAAKARFADEEKLRLAFLWKDTRKADKAGLFSLHGTRYQVGAALAGKQVDVRYDPEALDVVEIWRDGRFVERVKPFAVHTHRRPRADEEQPPTLENREPTIDWLSHVVERRRAESFVEPTPRQLAEQVRARKIAQIEAVVAAIAERIDPVVRDDAAVRGFLDRYGPFEPAAVVEVVDRVIAREGRDQHVARYLEAVRRDLGGAQ